MDYLDVLKPGKRENAFYVKSSIVDVDRVGEQSSYNEKFYINVWSPEQKKHIRKLVDRNQFDGLK